MAKSRSEKDCTPSKTHVLVEYLTVANRRNPKEAVVKTRSDAKSAWQQYYAGLQHPKDEELNKSPPADVIDYMVLSLDGRRRTKFGPAGARLTYCQGQIFDVDGVGRPLQLRVGHMRSLDETRNGVKSTDTSAKHALVRDEVVITIKEHSFMTTVQREKGCACGNEDHAGAQVIRYQFSVTDQRVIPMASALLLAYEHAGVAHMLSPSELLSRITQPIINPTVPSHVSSSQRPSKRPNEQSNDGTNDANARPHKTQKANEQDSTSNPTGLFAHIAGSNARSLQRAGKGQ
ncbi:MAG: hypothetical protein Q9159_007218 [Coniocarpon cinnabarinum]